jgi:hypothetical protein
MSDHGKPRVSLNYALPELDVLALRGSMQKRQSIGEEFAG